MDLEAARAVPANSVRRKAGVYRSSHVQLRGDSARAYALVSDREFKYRRIWEMIAHAASDKSFSRTRAWRFCYWGGLAALFAFAAWQRFSLPLDPIADPDTWGYLSPALRKLTGAEFGHTNGRNFVYPGFVFLLLRVFGDFRAITVAQHLLGLLAGGVLFLAWRRTLVFLPSPRIGRAGHAVLGLVATAIFLLATEPTRFEMQLRPEGVSAFLLSINFYVVIQFVVCCFVEGRRSATVAYGIAAVFSSILLASAKPSCVLAAGVVLLPVGLFFLRRGWLPQKVALGAGAVFSAALLLLPEHFLSRNDENSRTFLPTTLFVIHANLIRDQMSEDIQRGANVPYPREWLARIHATLSFEITKSFAAWPGHYSSLGFDPDYLMYNENSIAAQLQREFGNNVTALCTFYRFYYTRIWRQRPLLVVEKIARQMALFYKPACPAYNRRKSWPLTNEYARAMTSLEIEPYRKVWTTCPPAVDFMVRTEMLSRNAPVVQQPRLVRIMLIFPERSYLPLLLSALVISAMVLLRKNRRRSLGWLAALALLGYLYNAASCLEVAVIHSLEIRRYITVHFFSVIFAQFLALWFILEFALKTEITSLSGKRSI